MRKTLQRLLSSHVSLASQSLPPPEYLRDLRARDVQSPTRGDLDRPSNP